MRWAVGGKREKSIAAKRELRATRCVLRDERRKPVGES